MKWKLPWLEDGYRQATGIPNTAENAQFAQEYPDRWEKIRQDAELHFKLDFFEYYMLLERALVHLLGVFGISVNRQGDKWLGPGANDNGNQNGTRNVYTANHSYHQNVLSALEAKSNPLYEALGCGEVRAHLGRAKDLRNRWKYAEAQDDQAHPDPVASRAPLESYDLVNMFNHIFAGFDKGYMIANEWVDQLAGKADMVQGNPCAMADAPPMQDDEDMDFMLDAMDWEAV